MADTLAYLSAIELIRQYREHRLSPVEVARYLLRRIAEYDPQINAFRLTDAAITLAMAKASEDRWKRGEPCGLLDGIPISIKDLVTTKDWNTLRGSKAIDSTHQDSWVDAPVTARLREHGAVFLGKTNTPELGHKVVTQSLLTGITRNPWNLDKTPGGSSGGGAAALASGIGPLAVGTDGAGSIRIPSSFCNLFGLKPTWGRVPVYPVNTCDRLFTIGPMARNVCDAALMYNVMTRPDSRDCFALPPDHDDYLAHLKQGVKGIRIAYSPDLGTGCSVDSEVQAIVEQAVQQFEGLGAYLERVDIQWSVDLLELFLPFWQARYANVLRHNTAEKNQLIDPALLAIAAKGNQLSLSDYFTALNQKDIICAQVQKLFNDYDLLITPTMPIVAFDAGLLRPEGYSDSWSWVPFTYLFNLTEQPAASVPCGFTSTGLPVGMQVVGPRYSDGLIFQACYSFEQVSGFNERHPNL